MVGTIGTKEHAYVTYDEVDSLKSIPSTRKRNWKPFAIKLPFLASLALLCLLCILLLEVLVRHSKELDRSYLDALDQLRKRSVEPPVANVVPLRPAGPIRRLATSTTTTTATVQAIGTSRTSDNLKLTSVTTPSVKASTSAVCPTRTITLRVTVWNDGKAPPVTMTQGLEPVDTCVKSVTMTYTVTEAYLKLTSLTTPAANRGFTTTTSGYLELSSKTTPSVPVRQSYITSTSGYLTLTSKTTTPVKETPSTSETTQTGPFTTGLLETTSRTTPSVRPTYYSSTSGLLELTSRTTTPPVISTTGLLKPTSQTTPSVKPTYFSSTSGLLELTSRTTTPPVISTTGLLKPTSQTTPAARQGDVTSTYGDISGSLELTSRTTKGSAASLTSGVLSFTGDGYLGLYYTTTTGVKPSTTGYIGMTSSGYLSFTGDGYLGLYYTTTTGVKPSTTGYIGMTSSGYLSLTSESGYPGLKSRTTTGVQLSISTGYLGLTSRTSYLQPSSNGFRIISTTRSNAALSYYGTSEVTALGLSTSKRSSAKVTGTDRNLVSTASDLDDDEDSSTITSALSTNDGKVVPSTVTVQPSTTSRNLQPTDPSVLQQITDLRKPDLLVEGTGTLYAAWYFACLYLPSILGVIIKESWALTASGLKMTEPFYQLSRPDGGSVRKSLTSDYISATGSLCSIMSALRGDVLALVILIMNIVTSLIAPLSTEAMTIIPLLIYWDDAGHRHASNPGWVLSRLLVRTLQGVLAFCMLVIIVIAIFDFRRRSGLSANPSKIATMASLCNHPNIVQDLHQLNPTASDEEIEAALAHNRYKITTYQDAHGNSLYGLVKVGEITPQGVHRLPQDDMSNPGTEVTSMRGSEMSYTKRGKLDILIDGLLIFFIIGLLGVVVAYWLDGSSSGFNNFFNSRGFGPRFILSLGASITTATFQSIEREVRLVTPYRKLAARDASPKDTVLRSVDGTAVSSLFQSIKYGAWFGFFIALVTVLGDVLIIMIVGVPYSGAVTKESFVASSAISMALTSLMLIAAMTVFLWRRKNKKLRVPLEPNGSLIRTWMSLSNSNNRLRTILSEPGDMSKDSLRARVQADGGRYWAGWIKDDFNRSVWCVDKEFPIVQSYYHDDGSRPSSGAELESRHLQSSTHRNRFSFRSGASQTAPFIQTDYQPNPVVRINSDHLRRAEQANHFIDTEYRGSQANHRTVPDQPHPDVVRHNDEGDLSVRENARQAYPYVQTDYRGNSGRPGGGAETAPLI